MLPLIGNAVGESLVCAALPGAGALVAAAASISKARCEVDAEAATEAATQLASPGTAFGGKASNPISNTIELIQLPPSTKCMHPSTFHI